MYVHEILHSFFLYKVNSKIICHSLIFESLQLQTQKWCVGIIKWSCDIRYKTTYNIFRLQTAKLRVSMQTSVTVLGTKSQFLSCRATFDQYYKRRRRLRPQYKKTHCALGSARNIISTMLVCLLIIFSNVASRNTSKS